MTKTEALLKEKIRRKLGNVSTTEITDDQLGDVIEDTLYQYSQYKPRKKIGYITTTKDTGEYNVTDSDIATNVESSIISIIDCFYGMSGQYFDTDFPNILGNDFAMGRLSGISLFDNPAITNQYLQKLDYFKRKYGSDWEFWDRGDDAKILVLIPAPSSSGDKIYFLYTYRHTSILSVSDDDEDVFIDGCLWKATEMMIFSNRVNSVSSQGESVNINNSIWEKMSEKYEKRFKSSLGGNANIVLTG